MSSGPLGSVWANIMSSIQSVTSPNGRDIAQVDHARDLKVKTRRVEKYLVKLQPRAFSYKSEETGVVDG